MNEWDMAVTFRHPLVDMINQGETFTVTRYGDPIAVCVPYDEWRQMQGDTPGQVVDTETTRLIPQPPAP